MCFRSLNEDDDDNLYPCLINTSHLILRRNYLEHVAQCRTEEAQRPRPRPNIFYRLCRIVPVLPYVNNGDLIEANNNSNLETALITPNVSQDTSKLEIGIPITESSDYSLPNCSQRYSNTTNVALHERQHESILTSASNSSTSSTATCTKSITQSKIDVGKVEYPADLVEVKSAKLEETARNLKSNTSADNSQPLLERPSIRSASNTETISQSATNTSDDNIKSSKSKPNLEEIASPVKQAVPRPNTPTPQDDVQIYTFPNSCSTPRQCDQMRDILTQTDDEDDHLIIDPSEDAIPINTDVTRPLSVLKNDILRTDTPEPTAPIHSKVIRPVPILACSLQIKSPESAENTVQEQTAMRAELRSRLLALQKTGSPLFKTSDMSTALPFILNTPSDSDTSGSSYLDVSNISDDLTPTRDHEERNTTNTTNNNIDAAEPNYQHLEPSS